MLGTPRRSLATPSAEGHGRTRLLLALAHILFVGAPAAAEPPEVRRADGELVRFPELEERVPPVYPPLAKRMAEPGVVVVEAIVRADGTVDEPSVRHADPKAMGFEQAAKKAVKKWRYRPAMADGVPVDVRLDIVVDFAIEKQGAVQKRNAWPQFWLECRREAFAAKEKGDLAAAEDHYRHAAFDASGLGEADARLALAYRDLAGFLVKAGRAGEATTEYLHALEVYGEALGPDHADLAPVRLELAAVYEDLGQGSEARAQLSRALRTEERKPVPVFLEPILTRLGRLSLQDGRLDEAEEYLLRSRRLLSGASGGDSLKLAAVLQSLGRVYLAQDRSADAGPVLQESLRIREEQLGAEHPETLSSREDLQRASGGS